MFKTTQGGHTALGAQQTLLIPSRKLELNDTITVKASKIDIPSQTVTFMEVI